jgi:hypothetical protein
MIFTYMYFAIDDFRCSQAREFASICNHAEVSGSYEPQRSKATGMI